MASSNLVGHHADELMDVSADLRVVSKDEPTASSQCVEAVADACAALVAAGVKATRMATVVAWHSVGARLDCLCLALPASGAS